MLDDVALWRLVGDVINLRESVAGKSFLRVTTSRLLQIEAFGGWLQNHPTAADAVERID